MSNEQEQQAQAIQNLINSLKAEVYDVQSEAKTQIQKRDNFIVELAKALGLNVENSVQYSEIAKKVTELLGQVKEQEEELKKLRAKKTTRKTTKKDEKEGS